MKRHQSLTDQLKFSPALGRYYLERVDMSQKKSSELVFPVSLTPEIQARRSTGPRWAFEGFLAEHIDQAFERLNRR